MKLLLLTLTMISVVARPAQAGERPATEAEFRVAVEHAEQLAHGLQFELKRYREHLLVAVLRQGYGLHHPLFRTHLNGFVQKQVGLTDLNELKMGRFAFELKSSGKRLEPDPFPVWTEVQTWLVRYETSMDEERRVVARTNIFIAHGSQNIPLETFQKLRKRWRTATQQAGDAYSHALAVRAVPQ